MATLTLSVTAEELAALDLTAARYNVTAAVYVRRQLKDFLLKTVSLAAGTQWETRRKTLEADPVLAATVDAAVPARVVAPVVVERPRSRPAARRVVARRVVVAPRRKRKGR